MEVCNNGGGGRGRRCRGGGPRPYPGGPPCAGLALALPFVLTAPNQLEVGRLPRLTSSNIYGHFTLEKRSSQVRTWLLWVHQRIPKAPLMNNQDVVFRSQSALKMTFLHFKMLIMEYFKHPKDRREYNISSAHDTHLRHVNISPSLFEILLKRNTVAQRTTDFRL